MIASVARESQLGLRFEPPCTVGKDHGHERRSGRQSEQNSHGCRHDSDPDRLFAAHESRQTVEELWMKYIQLTEAEAAFRALRRRLIVGLNSDSSVRSHKGSSPPIVPHEQRAEMVLAVRRVDYVHIFDETVPMSFLEAACPDVHVNDAEYGGASRRKPSGIWALAFTSSTEGTESQRQHCCRRSEPTAQLATDSRTTRPRNVHLPSRFSTKRTPGIHSASLLSSQ